MSTNRFTKLGLFATALWVLGATSSPLAAAPADNDSQAAPQPNQPPGGPEAPGDPGPGFGGPPPFGPGGFDGPPPGFGFGGPPGFGPGGGGPGGPMNQERKVAKKFDKNSNGWLEIAERQAAREWLKSDAAGGGQFGGPGGRGGPRGRFGPGGGAQEAPQPGRKLTPAEVTSHPDAPVYDPAVLRTFFLEFENSDWEQELADFNNTDVEVPARVTVDGKSYADVGVHFRGATSFMFAGAGRKRPLNLSFDHVHKDQNLGGYRTFNLLNSHEDPSFLRAMLYLEIARDYIPAAKANFVRVVINGECWGIYISVQQFNKDFARDWYGTTLGARWKVPGSPQTRAGLEYRGEDPDEYRELYDLKSKNTPEVWAEFVKLCRTLNETELSQLPSAIEPILDVDGALRFLAVELVLVNNDGYWVRSSDYNIYLDKSGKFHIVPHDVNEAMSGGGGPGFGGQGPMGRRGRGGGMAGGPGFRGPGGGGPGGGGGVELDPLVGLNDPSKPLRSRLLAVPEYRERYLGYVRDIATRWLDWERLGPLAQTYHTLIAEDVKADTRKLDTTEAFLSSLEGTAAEGGTPTGGTENVGPWRGRGKPSLKAFADQRRAYLLKHAEVKAAPLRSTASK